MYTGAHHVFIIFNIWIGKEGYDYSLLDYN